MDIFLVIHTGPCGDHVLGGFTTKDKADKCKSEWDSQYTYQMDHAFIIRIVLDSNFIRNF